MKAIGHEPKSFEIKKKKARERTNWRGSISIGTKIFEAAGREKEEVRRQEGKARQNLPRPTPTLLCSQ